MRKTVLERFEEKFEKIDGNTCWEWKAHRTPKGYGSIKINRRMRSAHRVSWELYEGPIPEGLCILHRCDNPPCVRPSHLFLGTQAENVADMISKNRKAIGVNSGSNKLNESQVHEIRRIFQEGGISKRKLGRQFGVSDMTVFFIVTGQLWRHI